MDISKINSSAIAVVVVAILVGVVGFYTENNGFILAGAIFLLVGLLLGINQARGKK